MNYFFIYLALIFTNLSYSLEKNISKYNNNFNILEVYDENSFSKLPNEMLAEIFQHLDFKDIINLSLTNNWNYNYIPRISKNIFLDTKLNFNFQNKKESVLSQTYLEYAVKKNLFINIKILNYFSVFKNFPQFDYTQVYSLDLWGNLIGPKTAKVIANSVSLRNLRLLNLGNNKIGNKGLKELGKSKNLFNLKLLDLSSNRIGNSGLYSIKNTKVLTNLENLNFWGNRIGDRGAQSLAQSPLFANLEILDLSNNYIKSSGAIALAQSTKLCNLKHLDLANNKIDFPRATHIVVKFELSNLIYLNLSFNYIGSESLIFLYELKKTNINLQIQK